MRDAARDPFETDRCRLKLERPPLDDDRILDGEWTAAIGVLEVGLGARGRGHESRRENNQERTRSGHHRSSVGEPHGASAAGMR